MSTALFTAVTGLQAHQRRLDVVANNIANVNTIGYRGSRMVFQDLFSQTLQGGSGPVNGFGGTNPMQVGLGVQIGSIDVNHTQGSLFSTGVSSDLAIQGNGFFVLSDGNGTVYSRDGSFTLNSNGVLIDPATGLVVQGYLADGTGTIPANAVLTDLVIPVGATGIVRATTAADMIGNLHANTAVGDTVSRTITVFDSLGADRQVVVNFTKTANVNEWTWDAEFEGNALGNGTVTFNADGTLDATDPANRPTINIPGATLGGAGGSQPNDLSFVLDLVNVTQLSTPGQPVSDITLRNQDGFPLGILESYNIGGNGDINGVFTNGLSMMLGQVAVATFSNMGALARGGRNYFVETVASGTAQIGPPGTGGRGSVTGGVLENSNVDLGTEFSNLIITQRGFQANARTITAADTILQETVNLIR